MLTIRLALYIFYNTVQSKLDSSHAMRAGDHEDAICSVDSHFLVRTVL